MGRRAVAVTMAAMVAAGTVLAGCTGAPDQPVTGPPTSVVSSSAPSSSAAAVPTSAVPVPSPTTAPAIRDVPTVSVTSVTDVATDLDVPWGIAFLPDRTAVVTLRGEAKLLLVGPDGTVTPVVGQGADEVRATTKPAGEGGLLGVAVLPGATAVSADLALYQTTAGDNRVLRATLSGGTLGPTRPILTGIPRGSNHDGGRLAVGPDGMLYVTTGETGNRPLAQDPASLGGKVLRVTPDGAPAPGNPDPASPVWNTGHRNVQGIAWAPDGRVFASEFGQDTWDELNVLVPGGNYGWPTVEGFGGTARGFVDPLVTWHTADASPSGIAVTDEGVYLAALRGERLWRVPLHQLPAGAAPTDPAGVGQPQVVLDGYGRLRAVAVAPDGSLWVLTNNRDGRGTPRAGDDRILRVTLS
ncbi:MAG TPA: PQQ-dependent sugar dehydrogenase [Cellulomonas sp.]